MFGWRKKNDGFVWNEYVRTTVLLRREQRKQRIEDVRDAAVGGLKHAGKRGAELGVAGASAAGRSTWNSIVFATAAITDWVSVAAVATGLWLADRTQPLRHAIANATSSAFDVLRQPAVFGPLLLVGAVAAFSAAVRWNDHGFDRDATIAATLAALALAAAIIPQVSVWRVGERMGSAIDRLPFSDRLRPAITGSVGSAVQVGVVLAVMVGAISWLLPSLMSQPSGTPLVTRAAPAMTPASGRIESKAIAISGDEMRIGSEMVRLFGVERPDATQICAQSKSCAANAKAALQKLVGGKKVTCDVSGRLTETISRATCQVNGADVAGQLVRGGHVFATTGLFATYSSAEREARSNRVGLWRTDPARPSEHRAKLWEVAKQAAPTGCPIKGTVSGDSKTYLVPWSVSYDKSKVRQEKGERWFCTEEEAKAAGWKSSEPS